MLGGEVRGRASLARCSAIWQFNPAEILFAILGGEAPFKIRTEFDRTEPGFLRDWKVHFERVGINQARARSLEYQVAIAHPLHAVPVSTALVIRMKRELPRLVTGQFRDN